MARKTSPFLFFALVFVSLAVPLSGDAQLRNPETIAALQMAYRNEMEAHLNYLAYARKANSENYPNIAYLFSAFSTSEFIHARNFKKILGNLGVEVNDSPRSEIRVSATKENLKKAIDFELADIDQKYLKLIEKAKPDNHEEAIRNLIHAWETEKQHRDLLQKMQSGTGIFFGLLAKKIEEASVRYFMCQICGSTVVELPKDICPICKGSVSGYKEVERIK